MTEQTVNIVLTGLNAGAALVAIFFARQAAVASHEATRLTQDGLRIAQETAQAMHASTNLARENVLMGQATASAMADSVRFQAKTESVRHLLEVAKWTMEIGDRAGRVREGQPAYLLIHAVNRLQAALSALPAAALPECRALVGLHHSPDAALGRYINAFFEVEAKVKDILNDSA